MAKYLAEEKQEMIFELLRLGLGIGTIASIAGVNPRTVAKRRDYHRSRNQLLTPISTANQLSAAHRWGRYSKYQSIRNLSRQMIDDYEQTLIDRAMHTFSGCPLGNYDEPWQKLFIDVCDEPRISQQIHHQVIQYLDQVDELSDLKTLEDQIKALAREGEWIPCWRERKKVFDQAFSELDNRCRTILTAVYGLDGHLPQTLRQIAGVIHKSPTRVGQLKQRGLKELARVIDKNSGAETPLNMLQLYQRFQALSQAVKSLKDERDLLADKLAKISDIIGATTKIADQDAAEGKEGTQDSVLANKIIDLNFSKRAYNCLDSEGVEMVGDLVKKTEKELLDIRNFGRGCLAEVKAKLEVLELSLREEPETH